MRISTRGRYGLRVMLELATRYGTEPISLGVIAKCQGISRKYLHNVLANLKSLGLVKAVRGAGGGYLLTRPPSQINVAEIVQALEGTFCPVECVNDKSVCERSDFCVANEVWRELGDAMNQTLSRITLEYLVNRQIFKHNQRHMYYI